MSNERGSISIFAAVMAIAFLAAAGLALDGGRKLGAVSEARSLASNAARAGAQVLDLDAVRAGEADLDDPGASNRAYEYLDGVGPSGPVITMTARNAVVADDTITVTVTLQVATRFLPGPMTVQASHTAAAVDGASTP